MYLFLAMVESCYTFSLVHSGNFKLWRCQYQTRAGDYVAYVHGQVAPLMSLKSFSITVYVTTLNTRLSSFTDNIAVGKAGSTCSFILSKNVVSQFRPKVHT
jgi:hypothetical protein